MGIFDWFKKEPQKKENSEDESYYVKDTVTGEIIKVNKEEAKEVAKDYIEHITEDLKNIKIYKKGLAGLKPYLNQRPNIGRLFNQLIDYVDNGYSVSEYLLKADLIRYSNKEIIWSGEDINVFYVGVLDISNFYKNELENKEIPVIRKDYNTCIEAIKILKQAAKNKWNKEEVNHDKLVA